MADALKVVRVPVLSDNYAWLIHDEASGATAALDPGEAQPLLDAAAAHGWTIADVWITHWHPDHTGGIEGIVAATGARVTGPEAERDKFAGLDTGVGEGERVMLGDHVAQVMTVPGHTQGHIAYHFADETVIFTGDTLFAMGCGRLFEGTPSDMFANMQRYATLPGETRVCCGHEYTQGNGRYALVAEPGNAAIRDRMVEVDRLRAAGEPTVPTTIALERETNPFMRASSAEELGERRAAKDAFKG